MTSPARCRDCGAPLSDSTLHGLCLGCTAQIGFGFALQSTGPAPGGAEEVPGGADFGDYLLLKEVARGGMGVVYAARQKSLNRTVAVKMILSGRFASDDQVQRFRTEAEAAARLHHPNIVAIHEVGQVDGQHFFSMELVDGSDLGEMVSEKPLPADEAASLVQAIAEAVHYAHGEGVIHRDLKPSNILLDHRGAPRITDFGLAKLVSDSEWQAGGSLTLSGQAMGSPSFVAPEQAGGKSREATPAIDVYSLGAVLYFLLTARPPFVADSLEHTLSLVLNAPPPSPRLFNPGLPRDLETICLKCLDKDPGRRYANAEELAQDLGRSRRGEAIVARPATPAERAIRWAARNRALASLAAAAVLILVAGFAGILTQWRKAQSHAISEEQQRARAEATLADLQLQHAELRLQGGDTPEGLAYLAHLLETDPGNRAAAERLLSVLTHRSFALPRGAAVRHEAALTQAAFSPDGSLLVTASEDGSARIWSATNGEALTPPLVHQSAVLVARFRGDGQQIATATRDGIARVWDTSTGEAVTPPLEHESAVEHAEFHPTRPHLLTATRNGKVRVWDLATGQLRFSTLVQHKGEITTARFNPNGKEILSVGRFDRLLSIFDASSGKQLRKANFGGNTRIEAAGFSPDGSRAAIATYNDQVRVWDLSTGMIINRIKLENSGTDLAFSPDGELLATASRSGRAVVWDLSTGEAIRIFSGHQTWVQQVEFSADGLLLLTREFGRRAHVWDLLTGKALAQPLHFSSPLASIHFSPSGEAVLAATADGRAQSWDVRRTEKPSLLLDHPARINSAAIHPGAQRALLASVDGTATLWDTTTGEPLLTHEFESPAKVALSPEGREALLGLSNGQVVFWNLDTNEQRRARHAPRIQHCEFSSDGTRALTAGFAGSAQVFDVATAKAIGPPLKHKARLWHSSFSADGSKVVTASDDWNDPKGDNTARLWNPETGEELIPPMRHDGGLYQVVLSPDGTLVLTASFDHTAAIWDAGTGARRALLRHESVVQSARFNSSGQHIVTASWDNTARVWEAATGHPLTPPMRHDGEVHYAEFSPDGSRIVTACKSGRARLWDAQTGKPLSDPMPHEAPVLRTHFAADGQSVLSYARHARLWDIPRVTGPAPDWLPDLAHALAGRRLQAEGSVQLIDPDWSTLGGSFAGELEPWGEWLFADRNERPLSPQRAIGTQVLRERRAAAGGLEGTREGVRLAAGDGLAWHHLASQLDENETDRAFAEYCSRRSVALAPADRDLWLARHDYLIESERPAAALAAMEQAVTHHPDDPELLLHCADLLGGEEQHREALHHYASALVHLDDRRARLHHQAVLGRHRSQSELGDPGQAQELLIRAKEIPPRPGECADSCIDLSPHYNSALDEPWHNRNWKGNDLAMLLESPVPDFDIRGIVQVGGTNLDAAEPGFPEEIVGIDISRHASALRFLHGTGWGHEVKSGETIATYLIHYADQRTVALPVRAQVSVHEWHSGENGSKDLPRAKVIPLGKNKGGGSVRLYHLRFDNPHPEVAIMSVDFRSAMTDAAPFLVALTADPVPPASDPKIPSESP